MKAKTEPGVGGLRRLVQPTSSVHSHGGNIGLCSLTILSTVFPRRLDIGLPALAAHFSFSSLSELCTAQLAADSHPAPVNYEPSRPSSAALAARNLLSKA